MAQLQYIGARYVPKFYENSLDPSSMDWESGVGYEPLTVVTYNSDTYTSKVPVPSTVGAPDANPTYWAKTADYNAALVALQNAVNDIQNDEIPALKKGDYSAVVMLTDSFGENVTPNISTLVPAQMGWNNDQYLMHVKGGCGFSSNTPFQYLTELQSEASNILTKFGSADKVSCVIVTGGTNDAYYGNTEVQIYQSVKTFVDYVKATYPNAKIKLFFTGWTDKYNGVAGLNCDTLRIAMRAWEYACTDGIAFYDCHNALHQHSAFNGDHIHPTAATQRVIANMISSKLQGGEYHIHNELSVTATPDAAFNITGSIELFMTQNDDTITINFKGASTWWGVADIATASGGSFNTIKFATISDWFIAGNGRGNNRLKCFMVVNDGGGLKCIPAEFTFQADEIYVSFGDYHTTVINGYNFNKPSQGEAVFDSYTT